MSARHVLLIALVMLNLVLGTALVLELSAVRTAEAQVMGGGYNYAIVTAKLLQGSADALWVLDLRTRKLSVFRLPQGEKLTLRLLDTRDLQRDFRAGAKAR